MYAPAWMRVPPPIVVSFSISEPRPRMQSSSMVTRSRMHDWSPTMQPAPIAEPANTIAPVEIDGAVADRRRRQRLALRRRGGAERRLLADDRILEHAHAFAEHRALVDRRGRVDLSH